MLLSQVNPALLNKADDPHFTGRRRWTLPKPKRMNHSDTSIWLAVNYHSIPQRCFRMVLNSGKFSRIQMRSCGCTVKTWPGQRHCLATTPGRCPPPSPGTLILAHLNVIDSGHLSLLKQSVFHCGLILSLAKLRKQYFQQKVLLVAGPGGE